MFTVFESKRGQPRAKSLLITFGCRYFIFFWSYYRHLDTKLWKSCIDVSHALDGLLTPELEVVKYSVIVQNAIFEFNADI